MNAVPALVAGVQEIVAVVPPQGVTDAVLAACALSGVTRIFRIGGAQAVAALAYGTATVPRVDKIVGPGNRWVAEAKRQVVGQVGIDMIAGPTEVLILADATARPGARRGRPDRPGGARRGRRALVRHDRSGAGRGAAGGARGGAGHGAAGGDRADGARAERPDRAGAVDARGDRGGQPPGPRASRDRGEGAERVAGGIRHAGAIFLGDDTPEPVGDYIAGPSHVLPTSGTARYASPLGVYDFVKRTSVIRYTRARLADDADAIIALAEAEGLYGHAEAVRIRQAGDAAGRAAGLGVGADRRRTDAKFPPWPRPRRRADCAHLTQGPATPHAPPVAGARAHRRLHGAGGRRRAGSAARSRCWPMPGTCSPTSARWP